MNAINSIPQAKQFRLFISSTFNDMNAERNKLTDDSFKKIKGMCDERGVEFFQIDLRWGIPPGASKQGRVLETCMQEIDDARPFFIGIIGNRYGWQPTEQDLGERLESLLNRWDWMDEALHAGMSITEMEMQYAVLRKHSNDMNAAFYIRSDKMQVSAEFCELPGSEAERKLQMLKNKIRNQQDYPVREYDSPEQLAEMVLRDLQSVIEKTFPIQKGDSASRDFRYHEQILRMRSTTLFSLNRYSRQLRIWETLDPMSSNDSSLNKMLCITGWKGRGKSHLLAQEVALLRRQGAIVVYVDWEHVNNNDSGIDFVLDELINALGIRNRRQNNRIELTGCLIGLPIMMFKFAVKLTVKMPVLLFRSAFGNQERVDEEMAEGISDSIAKFASDFVAKPTKKKIKMLQKRLKKGIDKPLYIAIDNLDSLDSNELFLFALLGNLQHVRFIYSASTNTKAYLHLKEVMKASVVEVGNLDTNQATDYITNYLKRYGKQLDESREQCRRIMTNIGGSPQLLSYILNLLVCFGSHEELDQYITDVASVKNEEEVFGLLVDNIREQFAADEGGQIAIQVLVAMALVPDGFQEHEIRDLFSHNPLEWALVRPYVLNFCRTKDKYYYYIASEAACRAIQNHLSDCMNDIASMLAKHYEDLLKVNLQHTNAMGAPNVYKIQEDAQLLERQVKILPNIYLRTGNYESLYRWVTYIFADRLFTRNERISYWQVLYQHGYNMRNSSDPDMSPYVQMRCSELASYNGFKLDDWSLSHFKDVPVHSTGKERAEMYHRWIEVASIYGNSEDILWINSKTESILIKRARDVDDANASKQVIQMTSLYTNKEYDKAISIGNSLREKLKGPMVIGVDMIIAQSYIDKGEGQKALDLLRSDIPAIKEHMHLMPEENISPAISIYGMAAIDTNSQKDMHEALKLMNEYLGAETSQSLDTQHSANMLFIKSCILLKLNRNVEAKETAKTLRIVLQHLNLNTESADNVLLEVRMREESSHTDTST